MDIPTRWPPRRRSRRVPLPPAAPCPVSADTAAVGAAAVFREIGERRAAADPGRARGRAGRGERDGQAGLAVDGEGLRESRGQGRDGRARTGRRDGAPAGGLARVYPAAGASGAGSGSGWTSSGRRAARTTSAAS